MTNVVPKSVTPKKNNDFYESVFDVVRLIPYGRVTTYGAIATYLGSRQSARLVGWAMNVSHGVLPEVPAHRVVNRIGLLSGKAHFGSLNRMQELLEQEGILVENDLIVHFSDVFWDPSSIALL